MNITQEQEDIINNILTKNIIVEAVAGSGKTTTALEMAKRYLDKKFLLVTYNKDLKQDTREKVVKQNLNNIIVENYHSITMKYYGIRNAANDDAVLDVIENDLALAYDFIPDVLILDEVQDMNISFYKLIKKLLRDLNNEQISICVLGDRKQTLYRFMKSDYRYLELADEIFTYSKKEWIRLKLTESFRVPNKVCDFLNKCFYKTEFIKSNNINNVPIDYLIYDPYNIDQVSNIILNNIEIYGIKNTFLLANSLQTNSNINPLNNILNSVNDKFALFLKEKDIKTNDKNLKKNKLEITTINSTKGREKDLVIVYGFDEFYFKAYAKDENNKIPSDKFYVAITRAKQKVILLNTAWSAPLCFLDKYDILNTCNVVGDFEALNKKCELENRKKDKDIYFDVTQLIEYLDPSILYKFKKILSVEEYEFTNKANVDFSKIPFSIELNFKDKLIKENVSAINGSLITYIPLYMKTNFIDAVFKWINMIIEIRKAQDKNFQLTNEINNINDIFKKGNLSIQDLTHIACIIETAKSGRNYKYLQLKDSNFDWLNKTFMEDTLKVIEEIDPKGTMLFEEDLIINAENNDILKKINKELGLNTINLYGIYDGYNSETNELWEFKLTKNVDYEMFLQACIYSYIIQQKNKQSLKATYLFNLYTSKIYLLKFDIKEFEKILYEILYFKCTNVAEKNDNQFLKEVLNCE
ncbi:UvrD-helicase domain-containing protein [Spiroplasma tabanidicola]|uniref:Uncharacterized protein n=1 Tax=Spiroplasma tabanidicola TaxID=324079 RepID=A0A6I6C6S9_9MOLU|nr:UvrD-helicase domain-containing protein [Spiroplasma tabanidicola]QGS51486.1 hypothetical protein STABA_v1c01190 [Spiroplasma tabanidicola]